MASSSKNYEDTVKEWVADKDVLDIYYDYRIVNFSRGMIPAIAKLFSHDDSWISMTYDTILNILPKGKIGGCITYIRGSEDAVVGYGPDATIRKFEKYITSTGNNYKTRELIVENLKTKLGEKNAPFHTMEPFWSMQMKTEIIINASAQPDFKHLSLLNTETFLELNLFSFIAALMAVKCCLVENPTLGDFMNVYKHVTTSASYSLYSNPILSIEEPTEKEKEKIIQDDFASETFMISDVEENGKKFMQLEMMIPDYSGGDPTGEKFISYYDRLNSRSMKGKEMWNYLKTLDPKLKIV